jgi:hypothetical protein
MHPRSPALPCLLATVISPIACMTPAPEDPARPTYYEDVEPIVSRHCVRCHSPGGIGPFALTSYAEVKAHAPASAAEVRFGMMPPWPPSPAGLPLIDNPSLSEVEKDTFWRWAKAGAREGDVTNHHPYLAPEPEIRADVTVTMPAPFTASTPGDEYRCFLLDQAFPGDRFVTAFRARPGNAAVVHHVVLHEVPPEPALLERARKLDADDPEPGFSCWGGPNLEDDEGEQPRTRVVGSWKPGQVVQRMPLGTGVHVPQGAQLLLEMHYHAPTAGLSDLTSVDLEVTEEGVVPGVFYRITDRHFTVPLGARGMVIEPHGRIGADIPPGRLLGVFPHMHLYGQSVSALLMGPRAQALLLDVPAWDPDWQGSYSFAAPVALEPEQEIAVRCVFDNVPDRQPRINGVRVAPHDVSYGPGATDEMCLGFFYIVP